MRVVLQVVITSLMHKVKIYELSLWQYYVMINLRKALTLSSKAITIIQFVSGFLEFVRLQEHGHDSQTCKTRKKERNLKVATLKKRYK